MFAGAVNVLCVLRPALTPCGEIRKVAGQIPVQCARSARLWRLPRPAGAVASNSTIAQTITEEFCTRPNCGDVWNCVKAARISV